MYSKIESFFFNLTKKNWGAPWHFIIVNIVTALFIRLFSRHSLETPQMQIFTIAFFCFAIGYEIYQVLKEGQPIQGALVDMVCNVLGFLSACLTLSGMPQPETSGTGLAAIVAVPFLFKNKKRKDPKYLICVDPGHGGTDPGATREGIKESDINWYVATKLRDILQIFGLDVVMTRGYDMSVPLHDRCALENAMFADLFISIHTNASPYNHPHGVQTYYFRGSEQGEQIADFVQTKLERAHGEKTTWSRTFSSKLYVLEHTIAPAILVEMGFLSNKEDREKLRDKTYLKAIAAAIASAVKEMIEHSLAKKQA